MNGNSVLTEVVFDYVKSAWFPRDFMFRFKKKSIHFVKITIIIVALTEPIQLVLKLKLTNDYYLITDFSSKTIISLILADILPRRLLKVKLTIGTYLVAESGY